MLFPYLVLNPQVICTYKLKHIFNLTFQKILCVVMWTKVNFIYILTNFLKLCYIDSLKRSPTVRPAHYFCLRWLYVVIFFIIAYDYWQLHCIPLLTKKRELSLSLTHTHHMLTCSINYSVIKRTFIWIES